MAKTLPKLGGETDGNDALLIHLLEGVDTPMFFAAQYNSKAFKAWKTLNLFNRVQRAEGTYDQETYVLLEEFRGLSGRESWKYPDAELEKELIFNYVLQYQPLHNLTRHFVTADLGEQALAERLYSVTIDIQHDTILRDFDYDGRLLPGLSELISNALLAGGSQIRLQTAVFGQSENGPFMFLEEGLTTPFKIDIDYASIVYSEDEERRGLFFVILDDKDHALDEASEIVDNLNSPNPISSRGGGVGFKQTRNSLHDLGGDLKAVCYVTGEATARVGVYGYAAVARLIR